MRTNVASSDLSANQSAAAFLKQGLKKNNLVVSDTRPVIGQKRKRDDDGELGVRCDLVCVMCDLVFVWIVSLV